MRSRTFRQGHETRARSRSGLTLIGATVVLVATGVLAVWLLTTRPGLPAATGASSSSTLPANLHGDDTGSGPCVAQPDQAAPGLAAAPADLQWSVLDGNVVPSSATGGPSTLQGAVGRCFAHDAAGALLAAIRIPLAIGTAGVDTWRAIVDAGLVPGPGTDAVVAVAQHAYGSVGADGTGQSPAPVAGFSFIAYSPAQAVVAVVFRSSGGALFVSDTVVDWWADDWRVQPATDGQLGSPPAQVSSLVGYVALEQP